MLSKMNRYSLVICHSVKCQQYYVVLIYSTWTTNFKVTVTNYQLPFGLYFLILRMKPIEFNLRAAEYVNYRTEKSLFKSLFTPFASRVSNEKCGVHGIRRLLRAESNSNYIGYFYVLGIQWYTITHHQYRVWLISIIVQCFKERNIGFKFSMLSCS